MPTCNYCSKEFVKTFPNQVYCSIPCRTKMTKIKTRLRQKGYDGTLHPRICPSCNEKFYFYGMKKYCMKCVENFKKNPYMYRKVKK